MKKFSFLATWLFLAGCHHQARPPETAYDPELLKLAQEAAEEQKNQAPEPVKEEPVRTEGECSRDGVGCPPGYICWDSYFCKLGFTDQCSADGDRRCHKLCSDDGDCPRSEPRCVTRPIFAGSETGKEFKFCLGEGR
jgi:hypothetical protein